MFTVTRVDTLIRPVVNHRFVMQTMPPAMPEVVVEARVGPAGEEDAFRYRYRVCAREHLERMLEYEDAPAGYDHPTPRQSAWLDEASWTMPFSGAAEPDSFFGGRFDSLKVWAKPVYGAVEGQVLERGIGRVWGQEATGWRCWIVGGPLQRDDFVACTQELTTIQREQVMLEAIAEIEAGFTHFAQQAGIACPNEHYWGGTSVARYPWMTCARNRYGYGVMQITCPACPSRVEIWNWQANVAGGLAALRVKWNRAVYVLNHPPEEGADPGPITDEMLRREAYGWYNGGGYYAWEPAEGGIPAHWAPQHIQCDCDGSERKGRLINSQGVAYGECWTRGRCYADYIFNHNAEDW